MTTGGLDGFGGAAGSGGSNSNASGSTVDRGGGAGPWPFDEPMWELAGGAGLITGHCDGGSSPVASSGSAARHSKSPIVCSYSAENWNGATDSPRIGAPFTRTNARSTGRASLTSDQRPPFLPFPASAGGAGTS